MDKLKMGILGTEYIHMPALAQYIKHTKNMPFKVICVTDTNVDKGNRISKYFNARFYRDYEKLLDNEELDCVMIQSIVSDHTPMAIAAMEKNLHILCDKPIAENIENELKIYEVYKNKEIVFHTILPIRFSNPTMTVKKLIDVNYFGQILGINATNPGSAHIPDFPDWVHNKKYSGGGSIMDHTAHCADAMRWFLNAEVSEVYLEAEGKLRNWGVEDTAQVSLIFNNSIISTIEATWVRLPHNPEMFDVTFDIFGMEASISTRMMNSEKIIVRQEIMDLLTDREGDGCGKLQTDPMGGYGGIYGQGVFGEFFKAICNQPNMGADLVDGIKADEVAFSSYLSLQERKPVKLPIIKKIYQED